MHTAYSIGGQAGNYRPICPQADLMNPGAFEPSMQGSRLDPLTVTVSTCIQAEKHPLENHSLELAEAH